MTETMLADCKHLIPGGEDECLENEVFCFNVCLIKDHPQCDVGPCVKYKGRDIKEAQEVNTDPVCSKPCHGETCPENSTCRELLGLKTPCTDHDDCEGSGPWSQCEPSMACSKSKTTCEVNQDCKDGETCEELADAPKFCTWKFCIPNN